MADVAPGEPGTEPTGWWQRRSPATRRRLGGALAVVTAVLLGVVVGVTTATAQGSFGPHRATYSVTVDRAVTVDLGPIGSLVLDSPLPWPLGVDVVVGEIPAELQTESSATDPVRALAGDVDGYLQFATAPDVAVRSAARGLVRDALARSTLAASVVLVLVAAGRLASPSLLREETRRVLARPGVALLAGAAAVALVAAPVVASGTRGNTEGRTSPVLAGTPLAEARIVGRLGDLVDTYGARAVEAVRETQAFYARAAENLAAAYEGDAGPPPALLPGATPSPTTPTPTVPSPGEGGVLPPGPAPTATIGPPADEGARDEAAATPDVEPTVDPAAVVTVLVVSDLHCNIGMAQVVRQAVESTGAQAVLNAGDTVISGTAVESLCVDALADAVPDDVPLVVADGNHDTPETTTQEKASGAVVLEGDVVTVAGLRILGDAEARITTVVDGARLRAGETRMEVAARLADAACAARDAGNPVDLLLVHNPRAGLPALSTGCVPLQVSGHLHRQVGPTQHGLGILYVAGSTAGATAGRQSIGTLESPGVMTVLRLDPERRRPIDLRVLTVGTDATVQLGPWTPFPEPTDQQVAVDLGAPDEES